MKQLHRYIILNFIKPLLATVVIVLFIFTLWFFYRYIDELVGKGVGVGVILELLAYNAGMNIPLGLPIAVLFASLISFGNLSEFSEITAIKAGGISVIRALKPALLVMVAVALLGFYASNVIAPKCFVKVGTLLTDLRQKKDAFQLRPGVFYEDINGYSLLVNERGRTRNTFRDIVIHKSTPYRQAETIRAKDARIVLSPKADMLYLEMLNGRSYLQDEDREADMDRPITTLSITDFAESRQFIPLEGFELRRSSTDFFERMDYASTVQELVRKIKLEHKYLSNLQASTFAKIFPDKRLFTPLPGEERPFLSPKETEPAFYGTVANLFKKEGQKFKALVVDNRVLKNASAQNLIGKHVTPSLKPSDVLLTEKERLRMLSKNVQVVRSKLEYLRYRTTSAKEKIRDYEIAMHKKLALAASCFVLFLIGAPMAFLVHRGGLGMPLVISIFFFLLFYALNITGEKLAKTGVISPIVGVWSPIIILSAIAICLIHLCLKEIKPRDMLTALSYKTFKRTFKK